MWSSATESWMKGPYLPSRVCCGALVSGFDQRAMFMVGGRFNTEIGQQGLLSSIYKFRCWSDNVGDCHWQLLDQQLDTPRADFVGLMVPAHMTSCAGNSTSSLNECFHENRLQVGDGICDDLSNTKACHFDGGDCCGLEIVAFFCRDCYCYQDSMTRPTITTVGRVETYSKSCNFERMDGFDVTFSN